MKIINRKAKFNYKLFETYEAGIVLKGSEAKALRTNGADLNNSYAKIISGEIYLINANITIPGKIDYDPTRSRKLLLHKDQIISIASKIKQKQLTLIPTKIYLKGNLVKTEIALAKSKRKFEKKESIKKKDLDRELQQEFKGK